MNVAQIREYVSRINRVMDYIDQHIDQKLTLQELAQVASFSPYHFNRIFSGMVGETLFTFIQRLRLEKGAVMLKSYPSMPVTTVALKCGFASPAAFTRAFSMMFDMPPVAFRDSKISKAKCSLEQALRNGGNATAYHLSYDGVINTIRRQDMKLLKDDVKVVNHEERTLAYVRYIGPYAGNENLFASLYQKLYAWAIPAGVADPEKPEMDQLITIYHDDPSITDEEKLRISVGIVVPKDSEVSGEVGKLAIPAGLYGEGRFMLNAQQYGEAWSYMCKWLAGSGYEPSEGCCFESYNHNPESEAKGVHDVTICMPIKKMD